MKAIVLLALAGCGEVTSPRQTISFERPDSIDFVCLHVEVGSATGLPDSACDPDEDDCTAEEDPAVDACRDPQARLHALVAQSTRGELGVVDLVTDQILDVDDVVPGYTSHAVGALPVGVTVSTDGTTVWVASAAEENVLVLSSSALRDASLDDPQTFSLSDAPADMVLARVAGADRLVVAFPDEGTIAVVDPETGLEDGEGIPLGAPVGGDAGPGDGGADDAGPSDGGALAQARPVDLALASDGTVWVADLGTPRVWHVDLEAQVILGSIDVGSATRRVAVSPAEEGAPGGHWLYAVEADRGEVAIVDLTTETLVDPTAAPFDPLATTTNLDLPGLARDAVFVERTDPLEDGQEAGPFHLNGLFALVASTNGGIYVIDVRDDDTIDVPGVEETIRPLDTESRYQFAPHHPRSALYLTEDEAPIVTSGPDLVRTIGARDTSCDLVCLQPHFDGVCGPTFCESGGEPDESAAGIVMAWEDDDGSRDTLWRASSESWDVVFEGALPGSTRVRGRVETDGGDVLVDDRADFCKLGVEAGDRVVLLDDPLPADERPEACGAVDCSAFELGDDEEGLEVEVIGVTPSTIEVDWPGSGASCCFPELTRYQIRVRSGEWIVVGSETGYLHSWTSEGDVCVEDPAVPDAALPLRVGRARTGEPFENPYFSFVLSAGVDPEVLDADPVRDDAWSFTTGHELAPIVLDGGALVAQIVRAPVGEGLFAVDSSAGVVEFSLADLAVEAEFR